MKVRVQTITGIILLAHALGIALLSRYLPGYGWRVAGAAGWIAAILISIMLIISLIRNFVKTSHEMIQQPPDRS
jgi:predicted alpha/beta hydrolase family esterase